MTLELIKGTGQQNSKNVKTGEHKFYDHNNTARATPHKKGEKISPKPLQGSTTGHTRRDKRGNEK